MSAPELLKQANDLLSAGNADEAVAKYDEALAIVPDEVRHTILFNKGVALANASRTEDAIAAMKEALELKGDMAEARHNLAVFQLRAGQHDECCSTVDEIIGDSTEPGQTGVRMLKVQALLDKGDLEAALEAANSACDAAEADDAQAFRVRGMVLANTQQWADAVTDFEYANHHEKLKGADKQNYAMCLSQLSQEQQKEGSMEDAIATMEKSLAVHEHARRRVVLASFLAAADRHEDAVKAVEPVALADSGDAEAQRVYGVSLMKVERPFDSSKALEASFKALTQALAEGEEEAEDSKEQRKNLALNAGVGAFQAKKYKRAERLFQSALDLDPEWGIAKTNLFAAQQAIVDSKEEEEEEEETEEPGPLKMAWKPAGSAGGGAAAAEESGPVDAVKDDQDPHKVKWKKQRRPTWKAGIKTGLKPKKSAPVAPPSPIAAGQDGYKGVMFSLEELTASSVPAEVDKGRKEAYLSAAEFEGVFGMGKEDFYKLPKWKQVNQRKAKGLF